MISSPETLPRMAWAEYLAYEQDQSVRHELVDGYLYAMTGASDRHEEIALNLASALRVHLRSTVCRVYKSALKIRIADDFFYPDVFVSCSTFLLGTSLRSFAQPTVVTNLFNPYLYATIMMAAIISAIRGNR